MLVFTSVILSCTEHFSYESAPDVLINDLGATRVHIMHVAQGPKPCSILSGGSDFRLRPLHPQNIVCASIYSNLVVVLSVVADCVVVRSSPQGSRAGLRLREESSSRAVIRCGCLGSRKTKLLGAGIYFFLFVIVR